MKIFVRQIFTLTILGFIPLISFAQNGRVQLSNESKLSINGTSNVSDFRCQSEHELQQDSLQFDYHFESDTINVDGVSLSLEIDQFDCGKRGINRDFRSTLKYKEFPFINITLKELVLAEATDIVPTEAIVTINIAGNDREYAVPLTAFSSSENRILIGGTKTLYMSDFGLNPPSPLFGLVQVSDQLDVTFDLVIRL